MIFLTYVSFPLKRNREEKKMREKKKRERKRIAVL
jgi:hypothetical protein